MVNQYSINYQIDKSIITPAPQTAGMPSVSIDALGPYVPTAFTAYDGEKFAGGFGITDIFTTDYWTLRRRSAQLFKENLYAKGLIRRLITNEITTARTRSCKWISKCRLYDISC